MNRDLSVIIVNYNSGAFLGRCAVSLVAHLKGLDWDGVVVDNASSDGSEGAAASAAPWMRLVVNTENVGFGCGVNQGASQTTGALLLLLNPDACLLPGAIPLLCDELAAHPECGAVGPAVIDDDGRIQGSARGDPDMLTGLFGRSTWLSRRFPNLAVTRRNVIPDGQSGGDAAGVEVDWVSGSCMLVRREAFDQVGGIDPGYFMYWEDADFCRRLRSAGWRVRYRPGARVAHTVGQSSRTAKRLAIRAFHASAYRYYATHEAPSRWNPHRWIAWMLLRIRCAWLLCSLRLRAEASTPAPRGFSK
jgi:N-acetylglucosaminyl-diphospho-decaprenol L-rhamnosyltransferase